MHTLFKLFCCVAIPLVALQASGAITYIDAVPDLGAGGNTTLNGALFDGSNLVQGTGASTTTIQSDNLWYYRTPTATTNNGFPPNGGTFFETDGTASQESPQPLVTTISVPAAGTYDLYVMFIARPVSLTYGDIEAEVNNSGTTKFFFHLAGTTPTAAPHDQPGEWIDTFANNTQFAPESNPFPVATQWNQQGYYMYLGRMGTFNLTDTTVSFKINGPDAIKSGDGLPTFTRTLYEGVAYELVPPPAHPGDFDSDGDVDGADFVAWQTNFPKESGAVLAEGDADGDGDVDGADFVVWQTNFPFTPSPGASPVPEPATGFIAAAGLAAIVIVCRRIR
jgi:hypothetical protein